MQHLLLLPLLHLLLHTAATHATTTPVLYGLTRVKNSPSCSGAPSGCTQLVHINSHNGTLTKKGNGHQTIAAVGDLGVIDSNNRLYYYLGDGWNGTGTILMALHLQNGSVACAMNLNAHIKTVGIVGGEQSLLISTDKIFVTGLSSAAGPHVILVAPLTASGCLTFQQIGSFPYSGELPVAHSTTVSV